MKTSKENEFVIFYKFLGWHCWSLGIHIDISAPRLEIHIPSGWICTGWSKSRMKCPSTWEEGLFTLF